MKKVFIKYNPYKLETEFTVDGKNLAQNSEIGGRIANGARLQEWIEDLPKLMIDEFNDSNFEIVFHGTLLDYEDVTDVFTQAFNCGKLTAKLERIPAKETSDKEALIDNVFEKIKAGPFDELRDVEILSAFKHAKSSDFEVCVVATMSAGKSTLINSMLGTKLMPSKQEACTAIITRIKDTEGNDGWSAEVYSKENQLIETHEHLTYGTMERLNNDETVSVIKANGNIPFVSSSDASLVLIDTPGPNNARDPEHKKVQSSFLNKSSKALVLYIMEGTFGSDDDNTLLQRVADSMKVGGKQSKDRFIFVINKMDDRRQEDGDTARSLDQVRAYLKGHGISNPNLFPAAALPALNIRLLQNGVQLDEDTTDEIEMKVRKLNRNSNLHLEEYASLPASLRGEIKNRMTEAKDHGDPAAEALIHTGVVSIEAAIRQYVLKYAKTAKIKNIVDTFMHKLDEVGCFERTIHELDQNRQESDRIVKQISAIKAKIDDVKSAKQFKDNVDDAVVKVNDDARTIIDGIVKKYQDRLIERIDSVRGEELAISEVDQEVERLTRFAKKLEPDFKADLDELIHDNILDLGNTLVTRYKEKLASLGDEIDPNSLSSISIDPVKLVGSSVVTADGFSAKQLIQEKTVENGKEWVPNTDKKWYKPWTWFQESGYYRTKYMTVKYVPGDELAQEFLMPIQDNLLENKDAAYQYATRQANRIAIQFNAEFKRLDGVLKDKLTELESVVSNREPAQQRIEETERRLAWLKDIKAQVESILDI